MRDDRFEPVPSSGTLLRSAVAGMQPLLRDAPPALRRLTEAAEEAASRTDGGAPLQRDWHDTLLRIAVVGGITFLAWKLLRGLKSVLWTIFGLGMALYWTGGWRLFS